jgi:hypothetical protein
MNREAGLYFLAALLFVASMAINVITDGAMDTGNWLALVAAGLFALLGVKALRQPTA